MTTADLVVSRVKVGARSVAYRRAGSGPALVLLHGFTQDSRVWRPQLEGLSDEFTVIAMSLLARGGGPLGRWSRLRDSNPGPELYESPALPLS
jgi:pimeloyl-ACP methyl ester carboxylesterase